MATTNNFTFGVHDHPFELNFPYIDDDNLVVTLNDIEQQLGTNYTVINKTPNAAAGVGFLSGARIQFNAPIPTSGAVKVVRNTTLETAATFNTGSAIRAKDLNSNFTQNLYVTEEISNNAVLTDGSNAFDGDLNMGGNQITNLGAPAADSDAVTKQYVDSRFSSTSIPGYTRWRTTATASQTVFSGVGESGGTLAYSATRENVYVNGALQQRTVDYTADNGTTITFIVGLQAGDIVDVVCVNNVSTVTSDQSSELYFLQSGTGAETRTVESKLRDVVSVKDFGAVGDGVTDDTAAIQAAIDEVAANGNGGIVFFPVGTYRVSSTISNNRFVTPTLGRVSLKGADQNGSKILFVGTGTCFDFKHAVSGVPDANVAYTEISDLTLITNAYAVGKYGIVIDIGGFAKLSRLNMQGWDYALYLQDVDQFYAEKLTLRFNNNGILCRKNPVPTAVSTQPNNHTYVSCCFSNNFSFGGVWDGGSELSFFGGNVEKNGASVPNGGGLKFIDCGYEGGRGCNIQGVYFEGNQGLADLIIEATTVESTPILGAVHQVSSSFKRLSDASGFNATHNIYCNFGNPATVGKQQLVLIGSSFRVYSGYTESAATPFIKYNGVAADASNFFDFGSYYESSIEKPYFIQTVNKFDASVSKSTNQTFTTATPAQWLIDFNLNPTTYPLWVPDLTSNSILIPETGTYSISASLALSTTTAADKFLYIRKNGNNIGILNSNSGINVLSGSMTARLTAGDVLTFFYEQRTGSDQNIVGTSNFSNVSVSKIF